MKTPVMASLCVAILLSTWSNAAAETVERVFKVTFVSADLVYLNGGRAEGLFVGAKPVVFRDDQEFAELEVRHLAEHSSACQIVGRNVAILTGDAVKILVELKQAADSTSALPGAPTEPVAHHEPESQPTGRVEENAAERPRASGSIAFLYSNWDDHGDADLDFSQARADIDLRVEPLWATGLSFALRTSGRQDHRSSVRDGDRNDSWESRIATFSMEYKPVESRIAMSMGRINPARVGAIGRLDGAAVEYRTSEFVRIGAFAGANSQWQYAENRPNLQNYGIYTGYRRGTRAGVQLDQTISMVGQYHGGVASREALFAQGWITRNSRWNLNHSLEVDLNRGWRKDETNQTISLSTIYAQARLNLTRTIATSLSYDTRKSFRTYETRDIADSIFDDRVRQGFRAQVDLTLPEGFVLSAGAGLRSVSGETDHTVSYNGSVRQHGLLNEKSSLSVQGVMFRSDANRGFNLNASLGQGLRQQDWISLGAGLYSYTLEGASSNRLNRRVDLTARIGVTRSLALNAMGQLSGGDDTRGHRVGAGLSVQF